MVGVHWRQRMKQWRCRLCQRCDGRRGCRANSWAESQRVIHPPADQRRVTAEPAGTDTRQKRPAQLTPRPGTAMPSCAATQLCNALARLWHFTPFGSAEGERRAIAQGMVALHGAISGHSAGLRSQVRTS
jgi:hypothetical protein